MGRTVSGLRQEALTACRVCTRDLAAACFPEVAWRFSWSHGRSTWCAECIEAAAMLRAGGYAGALRELREKVRAMVCPKG